MSAIGATPGQLVRVSSEFPFYPGAQRIARLVSEGEIGDIIDVRAGFLHSSDLDPDKPINWKRTVEWNGEYGSMGDLGLHVVHLPFRFGWKPVNVRALLSNLVPRRPGPDGSLVGCDTWDNAVLAVEAEDDGRRFPMILEMKRIAPGEMDTWYLEVYGALTSVRFSTKAPRTLWTMEYRRGQEQSWQMKDLGYQAPYPTITGPIFEFGLPDAILQMWAAYVDELVNGNEMRQPFRCATPEEARMSHRLFTAALESQRDGSVVAV
jgi:predicted dehydrogenase